LADLERGEKRWFAYNAVWRDAELAPSVVIVGVSLEGADSIRFFKTITVIAAMSGFRSAKALVSRAKKIGRRNPLELPGGLE
jgi:hypothetical protein